MHDSWSCISWLLQDVLEIEILDNAYFKMMYNKQKWLDNVKPVIILGHKISFMHIGLSAQVNFFAY